MADPFSIVAGALGTADVCTSLARYLVEVVRGFKSIEDDIQHLLHRVTTIQKVAGTIKATFEAEWDSQPKSVDKDRKTINDLWQYTGEYLNDCLSIVSELNNLLCLLLGRSDESPEDQPRDAGDYGGELANPSSSLVQQAPSKLARLKLFIRKKGKEQEFLKIERRLDEALKSADLMLSAINLATTCQAQRRTSSSIGDISNEIVGAFDHLDQQIQQMQRDFRDAQENTMQRTLKAAETIRPLATLNEHFSLPRAVTSVYTGRRKALDDLQSFFFGANPGTSEGSQKRFCVYGLGGSGKTEFCCKFAQENQKRLWGVFWIDASSPERVRQTYSAIAKEAKRDPNERAAKTWLASSERPWLLIIDGANHDADLEELEDYVPEGASGMILVTTRNPVHRTLGTVGCRHFHFKELVEEDAISLLLMTAEEPRPWTGTTQKLASLIAESLGFLPLPLRHAGYAIMKQLATLSNYLTYYEHSWQRVRRSRKSIAMDEDEHLKAYASYEIMYAGLEAKKTMQSRDALDLLKTFAFLYRDGISETMIFKGAANVKLERDHHERIEREERIRRTKHWRRNWAEQLRTMPVLIHGLLTRIGTKSAIPPVLRPSKDSKGLDEHRLRAALTQLTTLSLVFYNRNTGSYSMHPLVHTWVRERPGMSTGEQAIYCHAAAILLAQCVLLPPLGTDESAENLKTEICPHIDQVHKFKLSIEKSLESNRASRSWYKRPVPSLQASLDRDTALQLVKFSLVYMQTGRWLEAKTLQETVRSFVLQYLGKSHNSTIDVTLLLSGTLWQLGLGDEAASLQAEVLELCRQVRGHDDAKTLKIVDALGGSRWLQGKFSIALLLHEEATAGLERCQGSGHPDTLIAQSNLGRVLARQCRYDEAIEFHTKAVHGLKGVYGASHLETLVAMDNLAMTYLDRFMYADGAGGDLKLAHDLEMHVMDTRKLKLGPEHTYTLWAICNLARVKAAQGKVIEAEYMITKGIKIATINLGPTHIGTLFGKLYLGHIMVSAKKFDQAEKMLNEVLDGHKSTGRPNHPDAILAMSYLIRCYRSSKREEDARQWRERLEAAIEAVGGQDHPFKKHLLEPQIKDFGMHVESTSIRSVHDSPAQQRTGPSNVPEDLATAKLVLTRSSTA